MDNISQIADGIYQIDTLERMPHDVITYFIQDEHPGIVDPGPTSAAPAILEALRHLRQKPQGVAYIFLSHIHMDHSGGVGHLVEHLPQARVIAHPQGVRHLVDPAKLIAGTKGVFGEDFQQKWGPVLPVPEERIQAVQDGEIISLGKKALQVIYSPGHAHHHLSFYEPRNRGLFVGEALGNILPGTDFVLPPIAPPKFDLVAYIETLNKLRGFSPAILFFPHNGTHTDVEKRFQLTYASLKKCFRIATEAIKAGESPRQIAQRFQAFIPAETMEELDLLINSVLPQVINSLKENGDSLEKVLLGSKGDAGR